jgi:hypothetical protein
MTPMALDFPLLLRIVQGSAESLGPTACTCHQVRSQLMDGKMYVCIFCIDSIARSAPVIAVPVSTLFYSEVHKCYEDWKIAVLDATASFEGISGALHHRKGMC